MKRELNFWVLGGDLRQACLARLLAEDGHRVHTYALSGSVVTPTENLTLADSLDGIGRADCVVLPLPVAGAEGMVNTPLTRSALPLASLLDALSPPQILCGGRVDPVSAAMADARGLILRDYFAREELAVANAVPTAEGAVQLAMEQMPVTIHGARVLITGFGRVGQAAARRFAALGARVSVAARRYEQLALAESEGYGAEQIGGLDGWLCGYDLVVNTVPAPVLGETELKDLRPDCLIIDLASKPGGVDIFYTLTDGDGNVFAGEVTALSPAEGFGALAGQRALSVQADMRGYTKDGADFLAGGTRLEPGASFAVTADGRELFIQIGSVVRK